MYASSQMTNHAPTRRSHVIGAGFFSRFFAVFGAASFAVTMDRKEAKRASNHARIACRTLKGTT